MLTREEIQRRLSERRGELHELGARRLRLFGSFARGEGRAESDVDLLVDLDHHGFDRYMDLKLYLEDLLDRRVDLVLADRIKPALREHILRDVIDAA